MVSADFEAVVSWHWLWDMRAHLSHNLKGKPVMAYKGTKMRISIPRGDVEKLYECLVQPESSWRHLKTYLPLKLRQDLASIFYKALRDTKVRNSL